MTRLAGRRRRRSEKRIPVVFLTGSTDSDTVHRAKAAEPLAYLLKPYHERDLKIAIEIALYKAKMEREREELTRQLEQALAETRTLRVLIPICAWCRKLRSDDGFWMSVEQYFGAHTEADCSHGIWPDCVKRQLGAGS